MKIYQQILSCLFLLALFIKEGLSLECYSCSSKDDHCDVVDKELTLKQTCSGNQSMCRKVEQHIYYNKEDHIRIFRQCATTGSPGTCYSRIGTYRFKSWYCHCAGEDFCNGSGNLMATITLTVTTLAAIFQIKKHL